MGEGEELIDCCEYGIGDRSYDDGKLICKHWDEYWIKPVIDIRNLWKDGEETKKIEGKWNVVYYYKGTVFCICPESGGQREMAFGGFEESRGTLKYRSSYLRVSLALCVMLAMALGIIKEKQKELIRSLVKAG